MERRTTIAAQEAATMDPIRELSNAVNQHAGVLNGLSRWQAESLAKTQQENLIKIGSAMYEKSSAYANVIMAAGYAGLFAVWSLTKSLLQPADVRWIAVCLIFSIAVFVMWELTKMIGAARVNENFAALAKPGVTPQQIGAALERIQRAAGASALLNSKGWPIVLVMAISPALVAAGLLVGGLLRGLP